MRQVLVASCRTFVKKSRRMFKTYWHLDLRHFPLLDLGQIMDCLPPILFLLLDLEHSMDRLLPILFLILDRLLPISFLLLDRLLPISFLLPAHLLPLIKMMQTWTTCIYHWTLWSPIMTLKTHLSRWQRIHHS